MCIQLGYRLNFPGSKRPVEVVGFNKKVMSSALKHYGIDTECEAPVYHIDVLYSHVKADSLWVEVPWAAVSFISFGLIPYKSEVEVVVEAKDLKSLVSSHVETSVRTDFSAYKVREVYELDSLAQERVGGNHNLEIQASLIAESIFDVIGKSKTTTP
ncbi:hypothetical protein ACES2I_08805 [Bdellovibrio bacteriovorus]|uniref:hypothetical protein n=1 Tax=Bdellovibrio bacteriovorus TaxID=959 RepID=UPI0035A6BCEE